MHNEVPRDTVEVRLVEKEHSPIQGIEAERQSIIDGFSNLANKVRQDLEQRNRSEPRAEDNGKRIATFEMIWEFEKGLDQNEKAVQSLFSGKRGIELRKIETSFGEELTRVKEKVVTLQGEYVKGLTPENRLATVNEQIRMLGLVSAQANRLRIVSPFLTIEAAKQHGTQVDEMQLEIDVRKAVENAEPELKRLQKQLNVAVEFLRTMQSSTLGELKQTYYKDDFTYERVFAIADQSQTDIKSVASEYVTYRKWCEQLSR